MGYGSPVMKGFKVRKSAQVAAFFAKAEGGSIHVLKLVKLIYLADRRFMEKYDCPILNDRFVSMGHGPANSMTLSYINGCEDRRADWDEFISDRADYKITLSNPDLELEDLDELSNAEIKVLSEIASKFKKWTRYRVRDYTHKNCPEWEDPGGSSTPIPYERILKFLGKKNFSAIAESIESELVIDRLLTD